MTYRRDLLRDERAVLDAFRKVSDQLDRCERAFLEDIGSTIDDGHAAGLRALRRRYADVLPDGTPELMPMPNPERRAS